MSRVSSTVGWVLCPVGDSRPRIPKADSGRSEHPPFGDHPFGENINLYDGTLSFDVTDVTLRGNGPTITVGRTLQFWQWVDQGTVGSQRPLGDWDLDIPRIETLVGSSGDASTAIWQTGLGGPRLRRARRSAAPISKCGRSYVPKDCYGSVNGKAVASVYPCHNHSAHAYEGIKRWGARSVL